MWQLPIMSDAYLKADESKQNQKKAQLKEKTVNLKFIRSSITGGGIVYLTQIKKMQSLGFVRFVAIDSLSALTMQ